MTEPFNPDIPDAGLIFSEKWYLRLKWATMVFLPALATLYFTLGSIWNFPAIEEVMGTITALATFFGVMLGISTRAYNNSEAKYGGLIDVNVNDLGDKTYTLALNSDPEQIDSMKEVTFKVSPPTEDLAN